MKEPTPTETELTILKVLWTRGPSTVREVHESLPRGGSMGYTSVLKMLQIMHEKGLVKRDTSQRAHIYDPAVDESKVERTLVAALMERVFAGSAHKLILRALDVKNTSREELDKIRDLLDDAERRE